MSRDQADLLRIIDYLDDRLSPGDMLEFEVRLADEPELAASFESFEGMDRLQRKLLERRARGGGAGRSWRHVGWLAAAALLLLALGLFREDLRGLFEREPGAGRPRIELAVLPSGPDPAAFHRELGLEVESGPEFPRSWESVRGADEEGRPDREYYDWVAPLQEQRLAAALAGPAADEALGYFTIALRTERELSALVLIIDSDGLIRGAEGGSWELAYPGRGPWTPAAGRLLPERIEVLPRRSAAWSEQDERLAEFEPGFLVPMGVEHVDVLVGLREEPLAEALRRDLMELMGVSSTGSATAEETRQSLEAWLLERDFELRSLRVESRP